jgi:hypothetical protein
MSVVGIVLSVRHRNGPEEAFYGRPGPSRGECRWWATFLGPEVVRDAERIASTIASSGRQCL